MNVKVIQYNNAIDKAYNDFETNCKTLLYKNLGFLRSATPKEIKVFVVSMLNRLQQEKLVSDDVINCIKAKEIELDVEGAADADNCEKHLIARSTQAAMAVSKEIKEISGHKDLPDDLFLDVD
jgi:hypothetical protein